MNISKETTKSVLTQLALGIFQQESGENQTPVSVLNPLIRQAWEYLCAVAYHHHAEIPDNFIDFVNLLHTPVKEWTIIGEHCQDLGLSNSVLDEDGLTLEFRALAETIANSYTPHLELEDSLFREIFDLCTKLEDARSYTAIRQFFIENPIHDDIYDLDESLGWEESLSTHVTQCYEVIPSMSIRGGDTQHIVKCPHCGWVLNWRGDDAYCHDGGACNKLYHPLATYENDPQYRVAYHPDLSRTCEGIQRYVVAPEIALLELYNQLQQEPFVQCELYPNFDSYDLLVILPSGDRWAVDVKDWSSAVSLALGLADKPFRYFPEWDKAFYVFPNYRANQTYMNEFKNYWTPQKDVRFTSQRKFVKLVREVAR